MIEFLVALSLMIAAAASSGPPDTLVVLQADPNGHIGQVVVTAGSDRQTLDQENTGVGVDATGTLGAVAAYSEADIQSLFAGALAAQPTPPKSYLLYFDTGSDALSPAAREALALAVTDIRSRRAVRISVVGHTDRVGAAELNARIGLARVDAVRAALIAEGVSAEVISAVSHGEYDPLIKTADEVPEPRNRRVEILVR
ncbi:MAG: flagellar motor protein MotB [Rhodospirillaceae bacterium]|nr:flagellar motor protein MotB [Magnetovibrio sp.]MAY67929.1 flagellar motor protein MotB [Rhodospirillaceae bacterium]